MELYPSAALRQKQEVAILVEGTVMAAMVVATTAATASGMEVPIVHEPSCQEAFPQAHARTTALAIEVVLGQATDQGSTGVDEVA